MRPAAAEIAAHPLPHLLARQLDPFPAKIARDLARHPTRRLSRHADGRTELPRRAVPALEAVMRHERHLQRMQPLALRQPLDRHDLPPLILDRQCEAAIDPLAIDQHGAGPAGALVAALLGARQSEMITQQVEEGCAQIDIDRDRAAVDCELHGNAPVRRRTAPRLERSVKVSIRTDTASVPALSGATYADLRFAS